MDSTWNLPSLSEVLFGFLRALLTILAAAISPYTSIPGPPTSDKSTETDSDSTGASVTDGSSNSTSSQTSRYEYGRGRCRGRYRVFGGPMPPRRFRILTYPGGRAIGLIEMGSTGSPWNLVMLGRPRFPRYRAGRLGVTSWVTRRAGGGRGDAVGRARRTVTRETEVHISAYGSHVGAHCSHFRDYRSDSEESEES